MATQSDGGNTLFDFTKIMADFDPNKMMDQFAKIMQDYKVPGVDTTAILENSRKNIEAVVTANRQAVGGLQAVVNRQGEMLRETTSEAASAFKQLSSGDNPAEMASKQMELIKPAFEKVLANARELAEMVQKSNTEAFETMKKRFEESFSEFKSAVQQVKK
jgi:phasin family protein